MGKWLGLVIVIASVAGCATPQTIIIETSPAGAAVSVDDEYIGKSPTVYEMQDASEFQRIRILAEKQSYETTAKLIKKKRNGMFPQQVFLKLDPSMSAAEHKAFSGMTPQMGRQRHGETTIQGPTIVIPGNMPAPQVTPPPAVTPQPAPNPASRGQQIIPLQD